MSYKQGHPAFKKLNARKNKCRPEKQSAWKRSGYCSPAEYEAAKKCTKSAKKKCTKSAKKKSVKKRAGPRSCDCDCE